MALRLGIDRIRRLLRRRLAANNPDPGPGVRLVAGLGNPGREYQATRHNAGFMVIDQLAEIHAIRFDFRRFNALYGLGRIGNTPVVLVKPMAFMNRCGPPIQSVAGHYRISSRGMVIIHDDLDLALGRLKIKQKGGHGGHKGIGSLMDALGGGDFVRLRVGIGRGCRTTSSGSVVEHVLGRFSEEETKMLKPVLERSCEAVDTILSKGTMEGMNRFNTREGMI